MLISARPASQRNGIRQTHIPLAAQCGAQETKPTQRVGTNNGYYNEGRTWRCLVLNPSARTRAEPHNFLSHKLLLTNSNAELLEIQEGRHLLSRKGNPSQWKKNTVPAFSITRTQKLWYRYCRGFHPAWNRSRLRRLARVSSCSSPCSSCRGG